MNGKENQNKLTFSKLILGGIGIAILVYLFRGLTSTPWKDIEWTVFLMEFALAVNLVGWFLVSPIRSSRKAARQRSSSNVTKAYNAISQVDGMEGHKFESWCADLLRRAGFKNVVVTPGSGDQGVDITAMKGGVKYAIQCKCYSSDLGNKPVQEVYAGKEMYHCHVGVVMTNRHFTKGAKELAQQTGVLLWDRAVLAALLAKLNGIPQKPVAPPTQAETKKYNGPEIPIASATLFPQSAPKVEAVPLHVESVKEKLQGMSIDYHFVDAVDLVTDTNMASVSMIQRRLRTDYRLAAQMIDTMETAGIVSPFNGSTPRTVLVTSADWTQIKKEMGL